MRQRLGQTHEQNHDRTRPAKDDPIYAAFGVTSDLQDRTTSRHMTCRRWIIGVLLIALGMAGGFALARLPVMKAARAEAMTAQNPASSADTMPGMTMAPIDHRTPFNTAMGQAMVTMDKKMDLPFTGDPDRDFARMMIPHHQGAIDMAQLELSYGKDVKLRRLAEEIVVTQQQEIAVMQMILQQLAGKTQP